MASVIAATEIMEPVLDEVIIIQYDGEYDKKTKTYHGTGTALLDNSSQYSGKFRYGLFHGKGRFTWPDGVSYDGDFEHGVMVGKGAYTWTDGSVYTGDIRNGKRDGMGKFVGSSKQTYEGGWRYGRRNGTGKIYYNLEKTVYYSGDWVDDLREGYGIMKYLSGGSYEGEWRADKKSGLGVMVWRATDEIYSGQWEDDLPHGSGEHIWGEGTMKGSMKKQVCNIYRGSFVQGRREGFGTFFYLNGSQYTGNWVNNTKEGNGLYIYPDGKIFSGMFEANRMVFATEADAAASQKGNDDISPQYSLNIEDLFERYPNPITDDAVAVALSEEKQVKEIERLMLKYNDSVRTVYKRYADYAVRQRQKEINAVQAMTMFDSYEITRVERTIITARNFQKRLFCMSVDAMKRLLREIGLIGPSFRCYDVIQCFRRMSSHLNLKAFNSYYDYMKAIIHKECKEKMPEPKIVISNLLKANTGTVSDTKLNEASASTSASASATRRGQPSSATALAPTSASAHELKKRAARNVAANAELQVAAEQEAFILAHNLEVTINERMGSVDWSEVNLTPAPILDGYFDPRSEEADFDVISSQPILEREYVELLVRCVAESCGRKGGAVASMTLYHSTYRFLAEQILSLAGNPENHVSPFYKLFYSDALQELLTASTSRTSSDENENVPLITNLELLWKKISRGKLTSRAGKIYLQQVVEYFMSLSGTSLVKDLTNEALLETMACVTTYPTSTKRKDFSSLFSLLDFDDFLELTIRVVSSSLWALDTEEAAATPSDELKEDGEGSAEVQVLSPEILIQRLTVWNDNLSF